MAVTKTDNKIQYSGNGTITNFPIPFYFLDEDDIIVILTDADGQDTIQVLTSQYTISGEGEQIGGSVTMATAPAQGEKLTFLRDVPITQTVDYVQGTAFPADTYDSSLDKITMIMQQIDEKLDRATLVAASSTEDPTSLFPEPVEDYYLQYDPTGSFLLAVDRLTLDLYNVVEDLTPQLGGDLDANGSHVLFDDATGFQDDSGNEQLIFQLDAFAVNYVVFRNAQSGGNLQVLSDGSDTNVGLTLDVKAVGSLTLGSADVPVVVDADSVTIKTGGTSRLDITDSGVRLGAANARVTTVLDEDSMVSDSATALATQQSIKAYTDNSEQLGQIIQVSETTLTSVFSTTSTTFTEVTGLTVDITPSSTANKIIVMVMISSGGNTMPHALVRDGSIIFQGDAASNRQRCTLRHQAGSVSTEGLLYLDSPATTSAVTYGVHVLVPSGNGYVNRSNSDLDNSQNYRTTSTILALELQGS